MNKSALIEAVAAKAQVSKVEAVKKGEGLQLIGYISLGVANRSARVSKNPRTGAVVNVPAKKVAKAKLGAKFAL